MSKLMQYVSEQCRPRVELIHLTMASGEFTCSTGYWTANSLPHQYHGSMSPFRFTYVLSGQGHYDDEEGRRYALKPGCGVYRHSNLHHRIERYDVEPWVEFFINMPNGLYQDLCRVHVLDPNEVLDVCVLTMDLVDKFESYLGGIANHAARSQRQVVGELLRMLTLFSKDEQPHQQLSPVEKKLNRAKTIMSKMDSRKLTIPDIASQVGMGYHHFRKAFAEYIGISPKEFRIRCLIEHAQHLCLDPNLSLSDIAHTLGYPDAATFSRQFKQVTGVSPRAYRQG